MKLGTSTIYNFPLFHCNGGHEIPGFAIMRFQRANVVLIKSSPHHRALINGGLEHYFHHKYTEDEDGSSGYCVKKNNKCCNQNQAAISFYFTARISSL